VCGVVYQASNTRVCQFSFVCDGALDRRPEPGAWNEAEAIARAALGGYVERSVGEATHYHADYVAPRWAPLLAKITRIGAHIFYRWPGAWGMPAAFTGRYIGEPADPSALRPAWRPAPAEGSGARSSVLPAGPPVARAANDVGGLLDTSKGWTLEIPDPAEFEKSSAIVAQQQSAKPAAAVGAVTAAASTAVSAIVASRE
jgi:hypothetical protein